MKRYYFTRSISGFIDLGDNSNNQEVREKLMNYEILQHCHINKEFIQIHKSHILDTKGDLKESTNITKGKNFFKKLIGQD